MKVSRAHFARVIVYTSALVYMAADLFVLHGPVRRIIERANRRGAEAPVTSGPQRIAGQVSGVAIPMRLLDQQVAIDLARGGRNPDISKLGARELLDFRLAAMDELMIGACLDAKIMARSGKGEDAPALDAAVLAEESRVGGSAALDDRLAAAGMDRSAFRTALGAEVARSRYLEEQMDACGANQAGEAEISDWLATRPDPPVLPARVKLRQIFKASLRQDPAALDAAVLALYHEALDGPRDFAAIAAAESDDPASKERGGDMGWVELLADRMPGGIDPAVLADGALKRPLPPVASRIGRHIFLIEARDPSRVATPAEMHDEVRAFLISKKRLDATMGIIKELKTAGQAEMDRQALESEPPAL